MRFERQGWKIEALFSNTLRAHELGRTHDWVVIYYHQDGVAGQCTVVTARKRRLLDLRVIKGRETECLRLYEQRRVA
jgi:DNA polymerase (family X)